MIFIDKTHLDCQSIWCEILEMVRKITRIPSVGLVDHISKSSSVVLGYICDKYDVLDTFSVLVVEKMMDL